jgi:hypothetical protein
MTDYCKTKTPISSQSPYGRQSPNRAAHTGSGAHTGPAYSRRDPPGVRVLPAGPETTGSRPRVVCFRTYRI